MRLTVDYRKLNSKTIPDKYPLPRLDDVLHAAKKTRFMTTLDLKSGYHQVTVKPADRDKTSFIAHSEYLGTRECLSDFAIPLQLSRDLWIDSELDCRIFVC